MHPTNIDTLVATHGINCTGSEDENERDVRGKFQISFNDSLTQAINNILIN